MKNIFLFGAGASGGSAHILPEPPPLGSNLFGKLRDRFPSVWGNLPEEFSLCFQGDFERGMFKVMESGNHWIGPLMQTMTIFFASFVPDQSRSDLYSLLLSEVQKKGLIQQTLFSTLNYECLLEFAANQVGLKIQYGDVPSPPDSAAVWKLHGSCNFIPDPKTVTMRRSASYAWSMQINAPLIYVSPAEAAAWVQGDNALYPAMCMFTLNKPSQISPAVFEACQKKWADLISSSEKVFVVGVRPHLVDTHIWGPLGSTGAKVYFIGSRSHFDYWLPKRTGGETRYLEETFEKAIERIAEELSS